MITLTKKSPRYGWTYKEVETGLLCDVVREVDQTITLKRGDDKLIAVPSELLADPTKYRLVSMNREINPQVGEIVSGSVVRLKSGGSPMTVECIANEAAKCAWFTTWGELEKFDEKWIPLCCLVLTEVDHAESAEGTIPIPTGSVG
jgi:uncharacterized protein YodC (DUF2158 family)